MKTNTSQSGLWRMTKGAFEESIRMMEVAIVRRGGSPRQLFDRIRTDGSFADRVAGFMLRGGVEGLMDYRIAWAIMGDNFFGPMDWERFYNVQFSVRQLQKIGVFPWNEDILNAPCPFHEGKSIKETHFAFLGLNLIKGKPLSILKWHERYPELDQSPNQLHFESYAPDVWYLGHRFAVESTCDFRWYLMPLGIIPNSTNKTYQMQLEILPAEYEVPLAIEEVTKIILYHHKNGTYPNPQECGRCKDVTGQVAFSTDNVHVVVGNIGDPDSLSDSLDVGYCPDLKPNFITGLTASRKQP